MLNLDEAREWMEILYGDTPGLMHVCSTVDWAGKTFGHETDPVAAALLYVQALDSGGAEGIYLRATTLRQEPDPNKRGGDDLSFYLPGLWADIDIAGPGHKTKSVLPPDVAEAMRIVEASGLPDPTHWIHSGGGLYPWWLLEGPVEVTNVEDFRSLSRGWQAALERGAKKIGYHYGSGVGDLSRVLRIPGTVNRKAGGERPCTMLEGHAWSGPLYTIPSLAQALEQVTPEEPKPSPIQIKMSQSSRDGEKPGEEFNRTASWRDILGPAGWQWIRKMGDTWYLRRPGKLSGGHSATLRDSSDRLWVFSEEAHPFEPFKLYDKFGAFTVLEHHGDFAAAARELARKGYGTRHDPLYSGTMEVAVPATVEESVSPGTTTAVATKSSTSIAEWDEQGIPVYSPIQFRAMDSWDGGGMGRMWAQLHKNTFRYVSGDKAWIHWDKQVWNRAELDRHHLATSTMVARMQILAKAKLKEAEQGGIKEEIAMCKELVKEAKRASYATSINGILANARAEPQIAASWKDFDNRRELVTLENGVLNLDTLELLPHDPSYMLTRKMNVSYDPDRKEGRFTRFMEEVLPDQEVREYLQRVCGYALTGKADNRILVQLYGPSGSGKSQFMKALFSVVGDFGKRASDSAFQTRPNNYKGPSEDLHQLMGSRFAMMPELDEGFRLNVALVKAIAGGDEMTTRKLYGQETTWRPEFTIFMTTNHLPRVAAGEEAYWNRVKPIKFGQVFVDSMGEVANEQDRNLGEKMAAEEPEVILNWLLEGLKKYRERGLDAPEQVTQWRDDYRDDVDTVRQFLNEAPAEGRIDTEPNSSVTVRHLHLAYAAWCADNQVPPLGMRKFNERMESAGFEKHKRESGITWSGIGLTGFMVEATTPVRRGFGSWQQRE